MFTTLLLPLFTMDFGFAAAAARRGAEMMQSAAVNGELGSGAGG
jgi:hypothetical protein